MLATEARVDSWKLRTGKLDDSDSFSRISDALDRLSKAPIYINDEAGNSTTRMKSFARRIKSEHWTRPDRCRLPPTHDCRQEL
jgi:replicative DNA helicase